ncbi:group I truncated hemoglobin [Piscinibacter sp.]|jgi:hemoglobin|uniref:group I truncated hemoglobin n=1 Tax=Piscinibacter sp. TaxID=1903157 RepID=UPI002F40F5BA
MLKRSILVGAALAAVLSLGGCATGSMQSQTLFQRLGGKDAIVAVVDDFVGNVAGDARINRRFASTNIPRLKQMLVDQICAGTGGPCTYSGRDMKSAHAGMNISDAEFGALVEDLIKSLDKFKVPEKEKNDLLAILGPMKGDIVGR